MDGGFWMWGGLTGAAVVVTVGLAVRPSREDRPFAVRRGSILSLALLWVALSAVTLYLTGPTALEEAGLAVAGAVLAAAFLLTREGVNGRRRDTEPRTTPGTLAERSGPIALAGLIIGADLLFGSVLLVAGLAPALPGVSSPWAAAASLVLSPGFLLVVFAQIVLLAGAGARGVDYRLKVLLLAQGTIVLLSPTLSPHADWGLGAALAGSAVIVAMFVVALQFLYRTKQISVPVSRYLVGWALAAVVTTAGWFLWDLDRSALFLAVAVVAQLALALGAVLVAPPENTGERRPWLVSPFWVFLFLLFTFLAEFFLGALLDLEIGGRGFLQYIPFTHPAGSFVAVLDAQLYNGLWFAAAILASAWFLAALGFTMGPLVLLKIRETHERPQKYRLGLTVAFYAVAAVYIPSFTSSTPLMNIPALASLPVLGWGFGLRAGGPFEASVSLAILLMYLGVGVLTVLFGRKALCSVMCGAALMYQGTAIHEMRQFNQTSKVGRYFLGSQLSTAYVVMSGIAVASLFSVSLLAFLHLLPAVQVANGRLDSAALPLPIELYFGGVWFVMFVSTPYIGTYNCATTGFCHWGTLSLPFAKFGFFRLKVKDRKVCQECTTFDCAKSCPVGLVDMPLYFRTTGEYRSSKCCGVGDCVGACPYGNMYHQDVRFWLRRRLGIEAPTTPSPTPRGIPLPMVPSIAPVPAASRAGLGTAPPGE
ncbi:MAG: hypothetical protein ACLQD8_01925 [Thermoplasmata archaeon]